MKLLFSPFEQFELDLLLPLSINSVVDISWSNLTLFLFLILSTISLFMVLSSKRVTFIPGVWQNLHEVFYTFVLGLIVEQVQKSKAKMFFPFFFVLFLFILTSNLLGLTPFAFTVTSHISVTFFFAFSFFLGWIILALRNLGLTFFKLEFLPSGVPTWLAPLLAAIEILSFFLRPISLSVRLFANMLAGHILLFVIASAGIFLAKYSILLTAFPFVFLLAFMVLEMGIALIQTYVFIILLSIYLHDSYTVSH